MIPVEGGRFDGTLTTVDTKSGATFDLGGSSRSLPLEKLVRWGNLVEAVETPQLFLADGGALVARIVGSKNERLDFESPLFGARAAPLESFRAILYRAPAEPGRRDQFIAKLLTRLGDADRLLLDNRDDLAGAALAIGEAAVEWESAVGKVSIETAKISGLAFNPALVTPAPKDAPRTLVGFRDGSRLLAATLATADQRVKLTLADGSTWTAPISEVECLEPYLGSATYLSDLPVESYRHLPFLATPWPYQLDRAVTGTQLRAGGRIHAKGIGMHSAARLTFRLSKPYRRFEADLAIDDSAGQGGSVVFRVFVDDKPKFQSEIIRGGATPVPISVDVAGGKLLSLIVDFAERGDELDRADWLDARLIE